MHIPTSASRNHWFVWFKIGHVAGQSHSGIRLSPRGEPGRSAHCRTTSRRLQLLRVAVARSHWPLSPVHTISQCTLVIDLQPPSRHHLGCWRPLPLKMTDRPPTPLDFDLLREFRRKSFKSFPAEILVQFSRRQSPS
ncbi:hypothetical protein F4781DRAFT_342444 [Annulohypoxylon bovei var. microspora]|nr:hypothetical protein F4781DRAFT_342444 [Annulohypoxylon bovei var. microspora]